MKTWEKLADIHDAIRKIDESIALLLNERRQLEADKIEMLKGNGVHTIDIGGAKMRVVTDATLPTGTIEFRQGNKTVLTVRNVGILKGE